MSSGPHSSIIFQTFDRKGESFAQYEKGAELRSRATSLDATKRGPALVPLMAARAQGICMALGSPKLISVDGVEEVAKGLKAYHAPDALDAGYQNAAKVHRHRKTTGNMDSYLA